MLCRRAHDSTKIAVKRLIPILACVALFPIARGQAQVPAPSTRKPSWPEDWRANWRVGRAGGLPSTLKTATWLVTEPFGFVTTTV